MSAESRACDLGAIAARIRPFVARRVHPDDVDDVLQEILLRVHTGFESTTDDVHFTRWVLRIASNTIVDHHRRSTRRDRKHQAYAGETESPDLFDSDAQAEFATFVAAFVEMLPSPYREAVTLTEIDGLTMSEAAQREGISESGMKTRVQRGRRLLRELFEACCEIALDARGRIMDYAPRRTS